MRRFGTLAVVTLALVAMFGTTATAARPAASLVARANHAAQGGHLHVMARVRHAVRPNAFSASATVHFASGDATVDLKRHGRSFVAGGKVAVPADQPVGPVSVDVSITYGAATTVVTATGVIQPPDPD